MTYAPRIHHRRSTRLRNWDDSWPAWYFVTLNVKNRERRFGEIRRYHKGVHDFAWQGRFYDRIIRDNGELDRVRAYIIRNPKAWTKS